MSDISSEQKLKLVEQVRSQYNRDRYDLQNREQILYGQTVLQKSSEEEAPVKSSFRIRLIAAIVLFALLILLDRENTEILGIPISRIFTSIENDYLIQMEEILNESQLFNGY